MMPGFWERYSAHPEKELFSPHTGDFQGHNTDFGFPSIERSKDRIVTPNSEFARGWWPAELGLAIG
jgi:hypothetical protein